MAGAGKRSPGMPTSCRSHDANMSADADWLMNAWRQEQFTLSVFDSALGYVNP